MSLEQRHDSLYAIARQPLAFGLGLARSHSLGVEFAVVSYAAGFIGGFQVAPLGRMRSS